MNWIEVISEGNTHIIQRVERKLFILLRKPGWKVRIKLGTIGRFLIRYFEIDNIFSHSRCCCKISKFMARFCYKPHLNTSLELIKNRFSSSRFRSGCRKTKKETFCLLSPRRQKKELDRSIPSELGITGPHNRTQCLQWPEIY